MAWRRLADRYPHSSLEELFCDPAIAEGFDRDAANLAPGFTPLDYRLGALLLRHEWNREQDRLDDLPSEELAFQTVPFMELRAEDLPSSGGVYRWTCSDGKLLYIGATECLARRFQSHLKESSLEFLKQWIGPLSAVQVEWCPAGWDHTRPMGHLIKALQETDTPLNLSFSTSQQSE